MKILLAAVSHASSMSGVQRHACNLVRCLLLHSQLTELHLVIAEWQLPMIHSAQLPCDARLTTHVAELGRDSISRNRWYYRSLPELAVNVEADLVHLTLPMPIHRAAFPCPTVVTLHDMYSYEIPANFGFPKSIFNRIVLRQCLTGAKAIACVSDSTLERLRQYAPTAITAKATRIYDCVEPSRFPAASPPLEFRSKEPFLLCIAQHRRNKNIPFLICVFHRLLQSGRIDPRTRLVVVGIEGPETARIKRCIFSKGLENRIDLLHGLEEPELQWLYGNCDALVAPSITEGFGLPVVEGLLAGCRVVCSDIRAHREVGQDQCRYVPLRGIREGREAAFAQAITAALGEPRKLPAHLPQFSAPAISAQYVGLYRGLVECAPIASRRSIACSVREGAGTHG